ncbi:MAG: hypothetical protein LKG20_11295, partial [Tetrasphaera jenkinsii]|nr:hypothetical protein [Tetrasphaera jenkinsii]
MPLNPVPLGDIPLTRAGLDRQAERRREPGLLERLLASESTLVLPIAGGMAPAHPFDAPTGGGPALRWREPREGDARHTSVFLGMARGRPHVALLLPPQAAGEGWLTLRGHGADLDPVDGEA